MALAEQHPRCGFRKLFVLRRKARHPWNHNSVWRAYCDMQLDIRLRCKRRSCSAAVATLMQPIAPNHAGSADFMSNALVDGRGFPTINDIDDDNREALQLEMEMDHSLSAQRVTRVLGQILLVRGAPELIRVDHGPEFTSRACVNCCQQQDILIAYTQPGKPCKTHSLRVRRHIPCRRAWCLMQHAFRPSP